MNPLCLHKIFRARSYRKALFAFPRIWVRGSNIVTLGPLACWRLSCLSLHHASDPTHYEPCTRIKEDTKTQRFPWGIGCPMGTYAVSPLVGVIIHRFTLGTRHASLAASSRTTCSSVLGLLYVNHKREDGSESPCSFHFTAALEYQCLVWKTLGGTNWGARSLI